MSSENIGKPFKVTFSDKIMYQDPVVVVAMVDIAGEAEVASPERSGEENDIVYVQTIIKIALREVMEFMGIQGVSAKNLPSRVSEIVEVCAASLIEKNFRVNTFNITSIGPASGVST